MTAPAGPRPLTSLVASARRLTNRTMTRQGSNAKSWQEDAWEMFDLVGEQRFLATTLAGRLAQAKLYVGTMPQDDTDDPVPTENTDVAAVLKAFGSSMAGRSAILNRMGINLFVAGDGWLAGIPRTLLPETLRGGLSLDETQVRSVSVGPSGASLGIRPGTEDGELDIEDLEWRMLSVSEVSSSAGGQVQLALGDGEKEQIKVEPEDIWLIRVWRPHPRRFWEADSPTRSSLPVLRELVGLTMHISAQVDSRLAGAGLLIVPQSAQRALQIAAGIPEDEMTDQFTEALMEAMLKPIEDRANASALVPLVVTVPDDAAGLFEFITFAKPLDTESRNLRDEAIRRLALGQDAPPELLLGTSGMNHWGAWLVQEDVVTTHLEPPLALICDALTTQYLWPVLIAQGMDEDAARQYVVWYDVSDLVVRPNRSQDALALHQRGVISDETVRNATGFDESDAPAVAAVLPQEVVLALEMARTSPTLVQNPGIPQLVAQIRAVLAGDIPMVSDPTAEPAAPAPAAPGGAAATGNLPPAPPPPRVPEGGGVPTTDGAPPSVPPAEAGGLAASGVSGNGRVYVG